MTTREYEAMFILKTTGTEQEVEKTATQLEEPIKKFGGAVARAAGMGRRKLAFRIARQSEGYYHLVRFSAPTENIKDLEKTYRLNERIVRFVILNGEEVPDRASAAPAGRS